MTDKLQALYDGLKDSYNLGSIDEFRTKMEDETKRRTFYDAVSPHYNLGDYDSFNSKLGYGNGNAVENAENANQRMVDAVTPTPEPTPAPAPTPEPAPAMKADDTYLTDEDRQEIADTAKMSWREANKLGKQAYGIAGQRPTADSSRQASEFINANRENATQYEETEKRNQERKIEEAKPIAQAYDEVAESMRENAKAMREADKQLERDYYALTKAASDYATEKYGPMPKKLSSKEGWGKAYEDYLKNNDPNNVIGQYNNQAERSKRNDYISFTEHMANQTERRAKQTMREAERGVVGNTIGGIGYGVSQPSSWSMGLSDLWTAEHILPLANKLKRGEPLNEYEQAALDAYGTYEEAANILREYDTRGFKAGETTGEMLPFMAQMALNPAGGLGESMAKQGVRKAVAKTAGDAVADVAMKEYGTMATKDLLKRYGVDGMMARLPIAVRRMGGDLAASAVLANTLQAGSTFNDVVQRKYGAPVQDGEHYTFDPQQEKSWAEAAYKGELSSIIENFTEMMGEWRVLGLADKMSNFGSKQVSRIVRALGDSDFAKGLGEVLKDAHWSGIIGETLEEEYGILLNSLLTGDNKFSDLWDLDQQIDIMLGVGLFGGLMGGAKMAAYPAEYVNRKNHLEDVTAACREWKGPEWDQIQERIDNADNDGLRAIVASAIAQGGEEQRNILLYIDALQRMRGITIARDLIPGDEDTKTMQEFYLNGYDGADKKAIQSAFEHKRGQLQQIGGNALLIADTDGLYATDEKGQQIFQGEMREMVRDYLNAKAAYYGMNDGIDDRAQRRAKAAELMVRSNDNNGRQVEATLRNGEQVHIISGEVGMTDNAPDMAHSSASIIIRHEDGSKEMISPALIKSIDNVQNTEEVALLAAQRAEEESRAEDLAELEESDPIIDLQTRADIENAENSGKADATYVKDAVVTLPDGTTGVVNMTPDQTDDRKVEVIWNNPNGRPAVEHISAQDLYDLEHPAVTASEIAQDEQVQNTEDEVRLSAEEQAYNDWTAKHGENSLNKLNQTRAYAEEKLSEQESQLAEVNQELADLPDIQDEEIVKKQNDLEKRKAELEQSIANYQAVLGQMNSIQSVYDAQNGVAEQVPTAEEKVAPAKEDGTGVRFSLTPEEQRRMDILLKRQQRRKLTAKEQTELEELTNQVYENTITDEVRQAAKERVDELNKASMERMLTDEERNEYLRMTDLAYDAHTAPGKLGEAIKRLQTITAEIVALEDKAENEGLSDEEKKTLNRLQRDYLMAEQAFVTDADIEDAQKLMDEYQKNTGVKMRLISDITKATEDDIKNAIKGGRSWITGDNEVVFVLPKIKHTGTDLGRMYRHEVLSHYNLKNSMSKEDWNQFLDEVWAVMPKEQRERLDKTYAQHYKKGHTDEEYHRLLADEFIATNAEKLFTKASEYRTIGQKIIDAITNWIRGDKKTDTPMDTPILPEFIEKKLRDVYGKKIDKQSDGKDESEDVRKSIAYHGSKADFDKFDLSHYGEGTGIFHPYGVYTTDNANRALSYADGNLYEVEIPDNLFDFNGFFSSEDKARILDVIEKNHPEEINKARREIGKRGSQGGYVIADYLTLADMEELGYAGFTKPMGIAAYREGDPLEMVIFNPDDVKILNHYRGTVDDIKEQLDANDIRYSIAYHGSGADFDQFDNKFMSTGEGNQAYGWGTYVTTNKETGKKYADVATARKTNRPYTYVGPKDKYDWHTKDDAIDAMVEYGGFENAKKHFDSQPQSPGTYGDTMQKFFNESSPEEWEGERYLYTVEIPDDNGENYLHWDGLLTQKQSDKIVNALLAMPEVYDTYGDQTEREVKSSLGYGTYGKNVEGALNYFLGNEMDYATGEDPGAERNSKFLNSLGFVGMQVAVDRRGGKRYDGDNYVIYNPDDIQIKDKTRFSIQDEETNDVFNRAIEEYGTTEDSNLAGYMLPDGRYLDFSEGSGMRTLDHRNVGMAYEGTVDEKYEYMNDFMKRGAIRIMPEGGGFELAVAPTFEQKRTLRQFIAERDGDVFVDFLNPDGGNPISAEYYEAEPSRVLADIDRYFNEGVKPISDVRYSIIDEANAKQKQPGEDIDTTDVDVRYSLSKNNRQAITAWLNKNKNLTDDEKRNVMGFIDNLDDTTLQLATGRWYGKGVIRLPEDMDKVEQAVEVARRAKVDPLQYDNPMELINQHADIKIKEKPIDPNTVSTLHKAQEFPEQGIVIYDVDESEESRENMRKIINTHYGEQASPWCLLQGDGKGNLTEDSKNYWDHYNSYPKQVAFKDGKLVAFSANDTDSRVWWDRQDTSHKGIPVADKVFEDGRRQHQMYLPVPGLMPYGPIFRGNLENGIYEEWYPNGQIAKRIGRKNGMPDGLSEYWYANGYRKSRSNYEEGRLRGLREFWYESTGRMSYRNNWGDIGVDGISETWHENGKMAVRANFVNGKQTGIEEMWNTKGKMIGHSLWKDGEKVGSLPLTDEKGEPAPGQDVEREEIPRFSIAEESPIRYSLVVDPELYDQLESGEKEKGYRNVTLNEDGTLGSPMAGRLGRANAGSVATSSFGLGAWEQSEENPDMADEYGKINLIKPDDKGEVRGVNYNPYIHIRPTAVNKQFTQAWNRPELVYIETEYPTSELTSGYKAEKANLPVGRHKWSNGDLILSRYDKPMRIVPWEEVADQWEKEFKKSGVTFDIVPPALLPILAERGVTILPPKKAAQQPAMEAYNQWREEQTGMPDYITDERDGEMISEETPDNTTRFSLSTWENGGREDFIAFVDSQIAAGVLPEDARETFISKMDETYKQAKKIYDSGDFETFNEWSDLEVARDSAGNSIYTVIKPNNEYGMNLDFSLVCKKRRTLNAVLNEMIDRDLIKYLGSADGDLSIARINELIRNYGFETACRLCFVDAKRFRQVKVADDFVQLYNGLVNKLIPRGSKIKATFFDFARTGRYSDTDQPLNQQADDQLNISALQKIIDTEDKKKKDEPGRTVTYKIAKHLLENPQDRQYVQREDFMSTRGFGNVKAENRAVLGLYNAKKGSGGPKVTEGDVQYLGDVAKAGWSPEEAFKVGGVRIQSFSDYVPHMVFDYIQMVADLAAGKFPAHAYTKEELFAKMFGRTGIKINLSLVPAVVEDGVAPGLDKDGNYVWQENETFPFDEAIAVQNAEGYRENCGTIAVGVSDQHILKMLADEDIRMVIPYHKSGLNKKIAVYNNIDKFTDYTKSQNTRYKDGKKLSKSDAADEPNFNELLQREGDPNAAAQAYLDWCTYHDYLPKFDQFAYDDKGNMRQGYYKLLEDFTTYVPNAEGGHDFYPQRAITLTLPEEGDAFGSSTDIMRRGMEEDEQLTRRQEAMVKPIVDEIQKMLTGEEPQTRYSIIGEVGAAHDTTSDGLERLRNLEVARQMESELNPDWNAQDDEIALKIKVATGWERGGDGKWRYEMPDAKLKDGALERKWGGKTTLADIVDAPELFRVYPALKDIKVKRETRSGRDGRYDHGNNMMYIGTGDYTYLLNRIKKYGEDAGFMPGYAQERAKEMIDDINSTLAHELQHAIQAQENFAKGGSPNMLKPGYDRSQLDQLRDDVNSLVVRYNNMTPLERSLNYSMRGEIERRRRAFKRELGNAVLGYQGYRSLGGEVEARNVSRRRNMTDEERRNTLLASTEDVARPDQFYIHRAVEDIPAEESVRFSIANENQRIFVSNAERAVEKIQQDKATPDQWLAMLTKNGGIKAGEDKWLGLSQWLKGLDGKVSKNQIQEFIAENGIRIEEEKYFEDIDLYDETLKDALNRIVGKEDLDELQEEVNADAESADRYDRLGEDADSADLDEYLMDVMTERYGDDFATAFTIEDGEVLFNIGPYEIDAEVYNNEVAGPENKAIESIRLGYTTDGLQNKREIALTIPTIEPWNTNDRIHFGDAGYGRAVVWMRFGDATIEHTNFTEEEKDEAQRIIHEYDNYRNELVDKYKHGPFFIAPFEREHPEEYAKLKDLFDRSEEARKVFQTNEAENQRVLTIDEIQSKRHQEGREQGYISEEEADARKRAWDEYKGYVDSVAKKYNADVDNLDKLTTDEEKAKAEELYRKAKEIREDLADKVPDAPFEKNWSELAMKRMLRLAAEEGYDYVAWTTGEQQAERYNLGTVAKRIVVRDNDGTYSVVAQGADGTFLNEWDDITKEQLPNYIGKELTSKVESGENLNERNGEKAHIFSGQELRIGTEGMKTFYDKMLVNFMDKYCKQWGVKVEDIFLPLLAEGPWQNAGNIGHGGLIMHSVRVTPEMKASVMEGQTMFSITPEMDADYRKAYEDGDVQKAEQMVKDAADANGYTIRGYHGAEVGGFTSFDDSIRKKTNAPEGSYFFFEDADNAQTYAGDNGQTYDVFLKLDNPYIHDANGENWDELTTEAEVIDANGESHRFPRFEDARAYAEQNGLDVSEISVSKVGTTNDIVNYAKENGYDGVIFRNILDTGYNDWDTMLGSYPTTEYVVFTPQQIKSAEPFVFDDNGELIPLSERFNEESSDIRYSFVGEQAASTLKTFSNEWIMMSDLNNAKAMERLGRSKEWIKSTTGWERGADGKWRYEMEDLELNDDFFEAQTIGDAVKESRLLTAYPELNDAKVLFKYVNPVEGSWFNGEKKEFYIEYSSPAYAAKALAHEIQHYIQEREGFAEGTSPEFFDEGKDLDYLNEVFSIDDDSSLKNLLDNIDDSKKDTPKFRAYNSVYALVASGYPVKDAKAKLISDMGQDPDSFFGKYKRTAGEVEARNVQRRMNMSLADRLASLASATEDMAREDQIIILNGAVQEYKEENEPIMAPLSDLTDTRYSISLDPSNVRSEYNDGDIVVYNPRDIADIQAAVMREAYTHKDIRNLNGWDGFMDAAYRMGSNDIVSRAMRNGFNFGEATEQWIFENAERMVAPFEKMMSENNIDLRYSVSGDEIRMYLIKREGLLDDIDLMVMREDLPVEPSVRFSTAGSPSARDLYDASQQSTLNNLYRAYIDYSKPLRDFQAIIAEESGKPIEDFENAWEAENQRSSKSKAEIEKYEITYFEPMRDAVKELQEAAGITYEEVLRYLIAKHGLERNVVLAMRDAEAQYKKYQQEHPTGTKTVDDFFNENRKRDYSGLTTLSGKDDVAEAEDYARDLVNAIESGALFETSELWKAISDAVKAIQKKRYNSGLISKSQMEHEADMFNNYIPLRGFAETIAEDVYDYYEDTQRNRPQRDRKAKGRTSLADDPLATIGAMAASAITLGNKNLVKQRFLNMVENHPTNLATVKDVWVVNVGTPTDSVWAPEYPNIHEGMTADEIDQELKDYDLRMDALQNMGMAKKATNKLDIKWRTLGQQAQQHIITIRRGGKEQMVIINGNPQVARTVNGVNNPDAQLSDFMRGVRAVQRFMAANFTTRNPAFVVSNLLRDVGFAVMATAAKEDTAYKRRFMRNISHSLVTITNMGKLIRKWQNGTLDDSNEIERYFGEFMDFGGETGYTAENTVDAYRKKMIQGLKSKNALQRGGETVLDFFELCNRSVEDMTRFTTYLTSRQMGRSVQRSVADAKNITVNFNRKGSGEMCQKYVASAFLFLNAGIQSLQNIAKISGVEFGLDADGKKIKINVNGKKLGKSVAILFGSQVLAGMLIPMLNEMMMGMLGGDDDDEPVTDEEGVVIETNPYRRLTEFERRNNICLWLGGDNFIKIPIAIELRAFYGLGETMYGMMAGMPNPNPGADVVDQMLDLLPVNFIESGGLVPDAVAPLWESFISNKNYQGVPLYNDSEFLENAPEASKVYSNTGDAYIAISRFINELGGGDEVSKSKLDTRLTNPAIMQHIVEGYLGGLLTTSRQTAKLIGQPIKQFVLGQEVEPIPAREWPVVNRLYINTDKRNDDRYVKDRYYFYRDQAEKMRHDERGYLERLDDPKYEKKYNELIESPEYMDYIAFGALNQAVKDAHNVVKELGSEYKEFEIDAMRNLVNALDEESNGIINPQGWGESIRGKDKNNAE
jgi:hypothetical protein